MCHVAMPGPMTRPDTAGFSKINNLTARQIYTLDRARLGRGAAPRESVR